MWLAALAADVAEGSRAQVVASDDFWQRIDSLQKEHEHLAMTWLQKLIAIRELPDPARTALRVRLLEVADSRGQLGDVIADAEALTENDDHGLWAQYLLAEHHRRRGDEARALAAYEAVLARDLGYRNAALRARQLRTSRGESAPADAGETVADLDRAGGAHASRYRLVRTLGRGQSGAVYLARDMELSREVAVKLLHPHLLAEKRSAACARFFAEARISASLRHPNIIAVLDADEGARRLVMELCAGGTVREVLRDRGPQSLRRALERHAQIVSALAAAHARGIVHRDVKPANLMFRRDPDAPGAEVVLADFGAAHLAGQEHPASSATAVGTLAYMAPEQRRGAGEPSSDLFAAAVVLYEMITGALPWSREVILSGKRARGDFALPAIAAGNEPPALVRAVAGHLFALGDPDPQARPTSPAAAAAARDLANLAIALA